MIKNLVNRMVNNSDAARPQNPASSGHGQPPRQEPSHKSSNAGAQHENSRPESAKTSKRRSRKPDLAASSWSLDEFAVEPKEGESRFHDLGLRDELMHGIADLGFHYCSPIQGAIASYAARQ